ncbi:MAG: hypothetical protein D6681_02895 [Calditrichaeota bacterium]|nr:MAG: hypothetical protein D6681_02895 [Calditrichota bacterium]
MRKGPFVGLLAVLMLLGVFFVYLQAGEGKMKMNKQVIEGTLVDTKCYAMGGFLTNDHMSMDGKKLPNCAVACASMGIPVALVDKDGNVHVLAVPAAAYKDWMAKELRLTGMTGKHAPVFIPEKLEVKENGKWVEKQLPGTMM